MPSVVLVTGVSRYLGGRLARILQNQPGIERVVGVDVVPPAHDLGKAEFVRADIRNPVIAKVITAAEVDTVVHMNVIATPLGSSGHAAMKEINVIGTMQLLAACQKAACVRKLVVKSSSVVYGVSAKDPAFFTEESEPRRLPRAGFAKDSVEVEGYVRGMARRRPDIDVTMLRFANILGPGIETPLGRYFRQSVVPTVMGFDSRLQFTHEDDALEALRQCTIGEHPGTFNVAGDGIIMLSQAVARAGRLNLPVVPWLAGAFGEVARRTRAIDFSPEQVEFLKYGRGIDTSRIRRELDWQPAHTTSETFDSFVAAHELHRVPPLEALASVESRVERRVSHEGAG